MPVGLKRQAFQYFLKCFQIATANIPDQYIHLPIAGSELSVYRERVYCYELYHQLKLAMINNHGYSLGGEVDKIGHPLFQSPRLKGAKPDLLIHKPGDMDGNLVVVEIKPIIANSKGIEKDLRTLTAFKREAGYYQSIYLVYGDSEETFQVFRTRALNSQTRDPEQIDTSEISLYWHCQSSMPAKQIKWR